MVHPSANSHRDSTDNHHCYPRSAWLGHRGLGKADEVFYNRVLSPLVQSRNHLIGDNVVFRVVPLGFGEALCK